MPFPCYLPLTSDKIFSIIRPSLIKSDGGDRPDDVRQPAYVGARCQFLRRGPRDELEATFEASAAAEAFFLLVTLFRRCLNDLKEVMR